MSESELHRLLQPLSGKLKVFILIGFIESTLPSEYIVPDEIDAEQSNILSISSTNNRFVFDSVPVGVETAADYEMV